MLLLWIHRNATLAPDEAKVCEAVFRYQIGELEKAIPGRISNYLTVEGANPPESLLARLRASNLRAKRGSFFFSELSSKGAWHFVIRGLERIDDKTFLVHGGYENDGLSASGDNYTVVSREGKWVIDKVIGRWVA